jgi:hypothetical protein
MPFVKDELKKKLRKSKIFYMLDSVIRTYNAYADSITKENL